MSQEVKLIPREIREADFPIARFLSEEEQTRYEQVIQEYSGKAREVLDIKRKGSNLFKILFLNQIGIRTATLPELESALENGLDLAGTYQDAREVVLRSAGDSYEPNDYLAKDLAGQMALKHFKVPFVVIGLEIKPDENSFYGLSFKTTDKTRTIEVSDLNHKNHQRKFKKINPDYSIEFEDNANRTLYTRDNGISRLYLNWDSDLGSRVGNLAGSDGIGRVVLVSAEGANEIFLEDYITKLSTERDNQITKVQKRYQSAMNVLKGN
jgi:hypothetical protein